MSSWWTTAEAENRERFNAMAYERVPVMRLSKFGYPTASMNSITANDEGGLRRIYRNEAKSAKFQAMRAK